MQELNSWFETYKRDFPWRENRTPYKVWISEVMLQQTRASVVIPYFERWLQLFPDVKALASAPIEKVIKAWEGLGYYSRARNLHAAAQQIVASFEGEIPSLRENLETIRGLGPYTIGAILSFGFQKRAAAVDGNVTRVLSRYFLIEENVCRQIAKRKIQEKAEECLDQKAPWVTAEALIELGATLCTPRPRCSECPLRRGCLALAQNKAESLPIKNAEKKVTELHRIVTLIQWQGRLLLKKGEARRVMADLYEFPYFEMGKKGWSRKKIVKAVLEKFALDVEMIAQLLEVNHTFTRYKAHLYPLLMEVRGIDPQPMSTEYEWILKEQLPSLPFSSGHRKILQNMSSIR